MTATADLGGSGPGGRRPSGPGPFRARSASTNRYTDGVRARSKPRSGGSVCASPADGTATASIVSTTSSPGQRWPVATCLPPCGTSVSGSTGPRIGCRGLDVPHTGGEGRLLPARTRERWGSPTPVRPAAGRNCEDGTGIVRPPEIADGFTVDWRTPLTCAGTTYLRAASVHGPGGPFGPLACPVLVVISTRRGLVQAGARVRRQPTRGVGRTAEDLCCARVVRKRLLPLLVKGGASR